MTVSALNLANAYPSLFTSTGLAMTTSPIVTSSNTASTSVSFSDIGNALASHNPLTVDQLIYLYQQNRQIITANAPLAISDSAASVAKNLSTLEQLSSQGAIDNISLTDSLPPQFSMISDDFINASNVLNLIQSPYAVQLTQLMSVTQALN